MAPGIMDHQDAPIWTAFEAKNFKQALKLVNKKISKKPTDYHAALRIYIQSSSLTAEKDKEVILNGFGKLLPPNPVLTDLNAIELYDAAFLNVSPDMPEEWAKVIGEVRLLRVKALPKDEEGSLTCFKECLMHDDIDHAQQIANFLEKNFPHNHAYHLWTITTLFYYSQSRKYPETSRNMRGRLSFALIGKLALETKKAGDAKPRPIKSIHTPQELLLLHSITQVHGSAEQRLDFLRDQYLGPESALAKGEWQLWRFKLQLLTATKKWQELFDTCGQLLKRARTKNGCGQINEARYSDWIVWNGFMRSASELGHTEQKSLVQSELEAHLDSASGIDKSWRRNAALASLTFHFERHGTDISLSTLNISKQLYRVSESRIALILDYLEQYGNASTTYDDLRPFAEQLDTGEASQLFQSLILSNSTTSEVHAKEQSASLRLQNEDVGDLLAPISRPRVEFDGLIFLKMTTINSITRFINTYKLIYLLTISVPEYKRYQSLDSKNMPTCMFCSASTHLHCVICLCKLAQATLRSYQRAICENKAITEKLLPTDQHPADDFIVITAMCLMKMSIAQTNIPNVYHLLQATVLLEYASAKSRHNFQITLLLIKLYSYIGCGSLAMRSYERLGLKGVQLDTLSHTLFDRISTFHPHRFSHQPDESSRLSDPLIHLKKQKDMYSASQEQIRRRTKNCFEHGSFNAALEIKEVNDRMASSVASAMASIECRRIGRLTESDSPVTTVSFSLDKFDGQHSIHDNNDFESYPNFECTQRPFFMSEFLDKIGMPQLSESRVKVNLAEEAVSSLQQQIFGPDRQQLNSNGNKGGLPSHSQIISQDSRRFTEAERILTLCNDAMGNILSSNISQVKEESLNKKVLDSNETLGRQLQSLQVMVQRIEDSAPTCQPDLHILYTALDLEAIVTKFCQQLPKVIKDTELRRNWEALKLEQKAEELLMETMTKCVEIKRNLDEGRLIDWILDGLLQEDSEDKESEIGKSLKELVDENFMELWAGQVMESWHDSVKGFFPNKKRT